MTRRQRIVRRLRARWRFVYLVTQGFKFEIFFCLAILLGSGLLIHQLHPEHPPFVRAVFATMSLFTVQEEVSFPAPPPGEPATPGIYVLQVLWFCLPLVGVTLVAEILVRLGVMVFNREEGREEWQVAVASTLRDHVVIVGFGHIGFRVVGQVAPRDARVVVIERDVKDEFRPVLEKYDVPLIEGDARRDDVLEKSGVARARAIMCLSNDDMANLEVALKARELNPSIKVVLRMFNESLARRLENAFDFQAVFSTTALAAPSFAAALWNSNILHSITLGDAQLHLARFELGAASRLVGLTVAQVEAEHAVNVLLHKSAGQASLLPRAESKLGPGDAVYVVGELEGIDEFDALTGTGGTSSRISRIPPSDVAALGDLARQLEKKLETGQGPRA